MFVDTRNGCFSSYECKYTPNAGCLMFSISTHWHRHSSWKLMCCRDRVHRRRHVKCAHMKRTRSFCQKKKKKRNAHQLIVDRCIIMHLDLVCPQIMMCLLFSFPETELLMSSHGCRLEHYHAFNVIYTHISTTLRSWIGLFLLLLIIPLLILVLVYCNKFTLVEYFSRHRRRHSTYHRLRHHRANVKFPRCGSVRCSVVIDEILIESSRKREKRMHWNKLNESNHTLDPL